MTASANPMQEVPPAAPEHDPDGGSIFTPYRRTQLLVLAASVLCFLLFWWTASAIHLPEQPGFEGSLLRQRGWPLDVLATYVLFAASVVIGTLIGGRAWFFTGLFAATVGLSALSVRGGPMRFVLFDAASSANTRGVFLQLLLEQCLLFVPIGLAWTHFWRRYEPQWSVPANEDAGSSADGSPPALAVAAQAGLMGLFVWILAATDAKKQVLIGVFVGGAAGTALADYLVPHRKALAWYWVGPFLVGAVGYVLAYYNAGTWTTGNPAGMFANLARPLPLDYASAGSAGALLGWWLTADRPRIPFSLRPGKGVASAAAPREERTGADLL